MWTLAWTAQGPHATRPSLNAKTARLWRARPRRTRIEIANHRHRHLLRPRRERPRDRPKQRDERAPFHVWMAPRLARENVACRTEVACSHVSGLFTQSGGTAGLD